MHKPEERRATDDLEHKQRGKRTEHRHNMKSPGRLIAVS